MVEFTEVVEILSRVMEGIGVAVIAIGSLVAIAKAYRVWRSGAQQNDIFRQFRTGVAQAILLGLELLVAGDIIRTVAVDPTFQSVGVLAIIVLIRTFLSFEMTLEIDGRWPWQQAPAVASTTESNPTNTAT